MTKSFPGGTHYQATLVSPRTPFDDFRDALMRGDTRAASRYPAAARRGLKIFGEGRCFFCHAGPAFTNGEFADVGRPFFSVGGVDPGRWGGLQSCSPAPTTGSACTLTRLPTMRVRSRRGMT